MLDLCMGTPHNEAGSTTYEVLVRGTLTDDLAAEIAARHFVPSGNKTLIVVDVIDQSHLHGVLSWLEGHNIPIERVNPL